MEKDAPILVTGAEGFIGRNLTATLKAQGYTRVLCFDVDTPKERLPVYAGKARFVFHLAGINRPQDPREFYEGNRGFTEPGAASAQGSGEPLPGAGDQFGPGGAGQRLRQIQAGGGGAGVFP